MSAVLNRSNFYERPTTAKVNPKRNSKVLDTKIKRFAKEDDLNQKMQASFKRIDENIMRSRGQQGLDQVTELADTFFDDDIPL